MLVCVTGGTGFVGAHSVAALVRAGCRVRLLARDAALAAVALGPLGVDADAVQVLTGDVRDPVAVRAAVRGADAVLHAASVYSFDSRLARQVRAVNVRGTEVVLEAALEAGVRRTVHVSSVVALFPARSRVVDQHSPAGGARETYMASKSAAEEVARRYQAEGAPVVITYPPALLGPDDPHCGDQSSRLRDTLRGLMPLWPLGGFPLGDVRDTARLHALLLDGSLPGENRVFGPGRYLTTSQYLSVLREVTGRPLPTGFLPGRAMLPVGLLADRVQRYWPWHIPAQYGAVYTCVCATRVSGRAPTGGITARPTAETMTDAVRWLHRSGRLSARQAGTAARPGAGGRAGGPAGADVPAEPAGGERL